jgi:hypothetical protein
MLAPIIQGVDKLAQGRIKKERQRLVLCRLMIDIMRTVHGAYALVDEPFGGRIIFFIAACVAIGDMDGKPSAGARILSKATEELSALDAFHYQAEDKGKAQERLAK